MPDWDNMTPERIRDFMKAAERWHKEIEDEMRAAHPEWTEEQLAEAMRGVCID